MDEKDPTKNTNIEVSNEPMEGDTSLVDADKKELEDTIKALTAKLEESEENSLKAQIEISSLTEKIHQMENYIQIKDDQNGILLGEKNSLEMKNSEAEARMSRINAAIQKIYNDKEDLKVENDKQKTTINLLQNKSPVLPSLGNTTTSDTIKKLNETNKSKTAEIADLKTKTRKLADYLSELQNKLNHEKGDDSEKCVKLTKAVSNKSKEVTELKNENKS